MTLKIKFLFFCFIIAAVASYFALQQNERPITLMATTTTQDSGLLAVIIPELERDTGFKINVVTFGTAKVLRSAMDGNADVILVHDPISEQEFMDQGYGTERLTIMRNDFVIVGPTSDPASIKNSLSAVQAFEAIYKTNSLFVSRGDESGTHKAELRIWQESKGGPEQFASAYYLPTGAGMGRSLNIAVEKSAYILTDNATWQTFQNKGDLSVLFDNDIMLKNIYSIISVNAGQHAHISANKQKAILNWFNSMKSRRLIESHKKSGQALFSPLQ